MKTFPITDRLVNKISGLTNPLIGKYRKSRLINTDFTIISNNCWAGICYEYYGLPKLSPTVGLYFFADEYIKFLNNLERYLSIDLRFINVHDSKYCKALIDKKQSNVPIGILDDVEIVFLHYKDAIIAREKWQRRVERVNWNNMIYKFSYMNNCTSGHIHAFENICSKRGASILNLCRMTSLNIRMLFL